jgi:hypothetical protein
VFWLTAGTNLAVLCDETVARHFISQTSSQLTSLNIYVMMIIIAASDSYPSLPTFCSNVILRMNPKVRILRVFVFLGLRHQATSLVFSSISKLNTASRKVDNQS